MTEPRAAGTKPPGGTGLLGRGIPLGRWGSVPISAHWSVLFAWALFADALAVSILPAAQPGRPAALYWLAGTGTALAFFAFLLAHELAHTVVARHYGVGVRSVTLWLLGGVSDLANEPPTARVDALIAAAGPAASLLLGTVSWTIAAWLSPGLLAASLAWLGAVSVLLAVFNLLPGAPLDGGRLLRALLWGHYHDRARAAAVAARTGRGLGFALGFLGVLELLTGSVAGLWLVLLGWFIAGAASAEQAAASSEVLRGMHAADAMTPVLLAAPEWWTVEQFLAQLPVRATGQAVYPLVDLPGQVTGALTLRELANVPPGQRADRRLREVPAGRPTPLVVTPDADLAEIARALPLHGGLAIVAEMGHPVGSITQLEVARAADLAGLRWRAPAPAGRG